MDYKRIKVTTYNGASFEFYRDNSGILRVICNMNGCYYNNRVVENSINNFEKGQKLVFKYYVGENIKTFESVSVISILKKIA